MLFYLSYEYLNLLNLILIFAIISGIFVIISKNPIVSILFLIGLFANISIFLYNLNLKFIALSYIIIYIGAVSILFLFILMLIDIRISELQNYNKNSILLALIICICFGIFILNIFNIDNILNVVKVVSINDWDSNIIYYTHISSIGNILYSTHATLIILNSLILLLAMVGAIIITIKNKNINFNIRKI